MWAQLQRISSGPEHQDALLEVFAQLRAIEPEASGLERTLVMRNQSNPDEVFVLVLFESEEKARIREQDPRRNEALEGVRAGLRAVLAGPPEFFDLDVVLDSTPS